MTPKKQKSKVQFREGPDSNQGDEELDKGVAEMENAKASSEPQPEMSEQTAATVTSTESAKKKVWECPRCFRYVQSGSEEGTGKEN